MSQSGDAQRITPPPLPLLQKQPDTHMDKLLRTHFVNGTTAQTGVRLLVCLGGGVCACSHLYVGEMCVLFACVCVNIEFVQIIFVIYMAVQFK